MRLFSPGLPFLSPFLHIAMHEAVMMWAKLPVRGILCGQPSFLFHPTPPSFSGKACNLDHRCCVLSVGFPLGFHPGVRSEGSGLEVCSSQSWLTGDTQFLSIINMSPTPKL